MFELFQYSPQISEIPDVCLQYQLVNCVNDAKLEELMEIVNSVKTAKDKAEITGKIANNHMKRIWEILNFDDSSVANKCLKIFPAVTNCVEFYQFIQKKGFMSDRTAFSSHVEIIKLQLQHEVNDYNQTVLIHLKSAFTYICPFLDTEQNFSELMNKIVRLCSEGVGFSNESRKCLETVNSNITMIQRWFSIAEVRVYNYCNTDLYVY